ncbi:deleted in malignant brain tumors 1 protein-like [Acanthaster planci]|uniref:Deleted in malignant brain tumors 1 protein-like n=1 Tax=Acanthaster planci TaxID=133434 RepID=A0A8B8A1G1_ACAPL|nr:deleted in malignant brain tumors 1 protein-like [Acanthaster planci]
MTSSYNLRIAFVAVLFGLSSSHPVNGDEEHAGTSAPCTSGPLGMQNGALPDRSITASSYYFGYYPRYARLNVGNYGWRPRYTSNQWIQVDLGQPTAVTGVTMQGRYIATSYYVRAFSVQYSLTAESGDWRSLSSANDEPITFLVYSGRPTNVTFPLVPIARFIRILPTQSYGSCYYLRFEVLGCQVPEDGSIKLVDGDDRHSGRVEIYHHGEGVSWGAVCADSWDINDANVVCRQLDLGAAIQASTASDFGSGDLPIVMNKVACEGTESRLADCPFVCTKYQQCNDSTIAGVVCQPKLNTIRLVGGSNNTSGRVEIYRNDTWGTICDDKWDIDDASVVCRELGFEDAKEAKSGAYFGQGRGPVHMDGVACAGSEDALGDCPSRCWEESTCGHSQDAGVICLGDEDTIGDIDTQ